MTRAQEVRAKLVEERDAIATKKIEKEVNIYYNAVMDVIELSMNAKTAKKYVETGFEYARTEENECAWRMRTVRVDGSVVDLEKNETEDGKYVGGWLPKMSNTDEVLLELKKCFDAEENYSIEFANGNEYFAVKVTL